MTGGVSNHPLTLQARHAGPRAADCSDLRHGQDGSIAGSAVHVFGGETQAAGASVRVPRCRGSRDGRVAALFHWQG